MRLPKKINVNGADWEIRRCKGAGGWFDACKHWIEVGRDCDDKRQWEIFVHELTEGVMADNLMRFQKPHHPPENGDYLFVFDHNDFEVMLAKPLAAALFPLVQKKGK